MAFGRHESFALRYSWLPKGFRHMMNDDSVFHSQDATVRLGVGKNMVAAIKYWLRACRIMDSEKYVPTELGKRLFCEEGFDPYLEDEATIWLLHWLLSTNAELATSWFWFFNKFHKSEFLAQELSTALTDFVYGQIPNKKKPSPTTLRNDALLITRMYTQSNKGHLTPIEESLDSPFALLGLVSQNKTRRSFCSRPSSRPNIPTGVIGFAVCESFEMKNTRLIPIEDFMYGTDYFPALGSIFRLTEGDLIAKLEKLIEYIPGSFEIRDTAGQHQLYLLADVRAIDFLTKHYNPAKDIAV